MEILEGGSFQDLFGAITAGGTDTSNLVWDDASQSFVYSGTTNINAPYGSQYGSQYPVAPDQNMSLDPSLTDPNAFADPNANTVNVPMSTPISSLPDPSQIVVYDASAKAYPNNGFGSYNVFYGPGDVIRGALALSGNSESLANAGAGYVWTSCNSGWDAGGLNHDTKWRLSKGDGSCTDIPSGGDISALSGSAGDGPLVGNPNNPDTAKLRWAKDKSVWFWYLQDAPDWATAVQRAAIAATNAQTQAGLDAAAKAQQALDAKAADDQARADQAALHAQQQAQQQADADAQVAATAQASVDAAAASQAAIQDAKDQSSQLEVDRQTQAAQLEVDKAAALQDVQYQQAQNDLNIRAAAAQLDLENKQAQSGMPTMADSDTADSGANTDATMADSTVSPADAMADPNRTYPSVSSSNDPFSSSGPDPFNDGTQLINKPDMS